MHAAQRHCPACPGNPSLAQGAVCVARNSRAVTVRKGGVCSAICGRPSNDRVLAQGRLSGEADREAPCPGLNHRLDLRLGKTAFRVRSSFLPGPSHSVAERIEALKLHEIDLSQGAVLERGCVYLVPLEESLDLPAEVSASANPKSSTGRLDVFTRVIGDRARGFDQLPPGYSGPLYLEISPRTFPVLVRTGSRLSQMRFRCGDARLSVAQHKALHASDTLVIGGEQPVDHGVALSGTASLVSARVAIRPSSMSTRKARLMSSISGTRSIAIAAAS
jgi:deoxycytidine triphosphate deaminase